MNTIPRLELLAPSLLTTDKNVRKDLNLNKPFLDNIKLNGVLEPIVAYPDPINDGQYRIYLGHRRTAAAIEGNVPTVPVYIISERDAEARIGDQLAENIHRAALTPAEVAGGYHELSLFGRSAMAIAKQTSTKLATVGDAIRVAKAPAATRALEQYQLSIDDALVFAEFENDDDALVDLNETATHRPDQIAHRAQQLRNDRTEAAGRQIVLDEIAASGVTLLKTSPSFDDKTFRRADALYTGPGMSTLVNLEKVLAEAGNDLRAFVGRIPTGWGEAATYKVGYAVANWESHGWHSSIGGAVATGPLTEKEKAERRQSRENGKQWVAATQVRIAWMKELLQRRSLPSDATALAALYFATLPNDYGSKITRLAHALIGVQQVETKSESGYLMSTSNELLSIVRTSPIQAPHVLLAIAAAAIESGLDEKKGWNHPGEQLPMYLRQLSVWGYTLSPLEENLVNAMQPTA